MEDFNFDYNSHFDARLIIRKIGVKNAVSLVGSLEELLIHTAQKKEKVPVDFATEDDIRNIENQNIVRDEIISRRNDINLRFFEALSFEKKMVYVRSFIDSHKLSDVLKCLFDYNYGIDYGAFKQANSIEGIDDFGVNEFETGDSVRQELSEAKKSIPLSDVIVNNCLNDKTKYYLALKLLTSILNEEKERDHWFEQQKSSEAYRDSVDWSRINKPYSEVCELCDAGSGEPCRLSDPQNCSR